MRVPPFVEPIVDSALFELAKEQKVKNTTRSGNTKYEYLIKTQSVMEMQ
ncbi:hypothetical protein GCM10008018_31210 [Paenibacillus marchantiophytorum]|uniref:Uncharacterized protein n=1 Tax=Paenibacillus marchantiophytorum TaxID=1619310 RepID=A0ABQ1EQU6_9BACL|nr:hypothetical protein [Paenibacillus marchantiophytorum]GFZ83022.1 hypothetical protein GCM10008018_31210 [Paenibacillus marchantiophytorum]